MTPEVRVRKLETRVRTYEDGRLVSESTSAAVEISGGPAWPWTITYYGREAE